MSAPSFAVVGHPNKGKSSIVSSLAEDSSVEIGEFPGTTVVCRNFPMSIEGKVLYNLIDTPGFQRPRQALEWLLEHETSIDKHPDIVRAFVEDESNIKKFPDETRLLQPIVSGAGILYVVDGSVPYGSEYEAEMEILRWTAQPRLAIVNPIGGEDYVDDWTNALSQYFNVVRVFNPLTADFEKRLELLSSFASLRQEWRPLLESAVQTLQEDRIRHVRRASNVVAHSLFEILSHTVERKIDSSDDEDRVREQLERKYEQDVVNKEQYCRAKVQELYGLQISLSEEELIKEFDRLELFSQETWRLFGLGKRELVTLGLVSGAALGGAIDVSLGGATFFAGSLLGGVLGAGAMLFGGEKIVDYKILLLPLGSKLSIVGPAQNANMGFVLLGRARLHHALVAQRSHANRRTMKMSEAVSHYIEPIEMSDNRRLEGVFRAIRSSTSTADDLIKLQEIIEKRMRDDVLRMKKTKN
jgi:GTPase Era involved in 16S rRNA processing